MPWVGAKYKFASTFSYRLPNFSSSYALSALTPSPSTIKLAAVSSAISKDGNVKKGEQLFKEICTARVSIELPDRIAAFKSFIKRLKPKRQGSGFEKTFGIREYVIYDGLLGIYIEVPDHISGEVTDALENVSFFGTSDSMCYCIKSSLQEPPWNRCIRPYFDSEYRRTSRDGLVFLLTDFTEHTAFENVNPYSKKKLREEKHITLIPYFFPIKVIKKESNCIIYQLQKSLK